MAYFPFMIQLDDKQCLIVGGGAVAARKAAQMCEFGACVTVVAPEICAELLAIADTERIDETAGIVENIDGNCQKKPERIRVMAKRVGTAEFEAEVLKEKLPVIVEFYSDSCIPCKQLSPILGGIEDDYEDQVKVVKVNVNFDTDLAGKYQVMASPTILFFKDGREVDRIRGLVKRPELEDKVKTILE